MWFTVDNKYSESLQNVHRVVCESSPSPQPSILDIPSLQSLSITSTRAFSNVKDFSVKGSRLFSCHLTPRYWSSFNLFPFLLCFFHILIPISTPTPIPMESTSTNSPSTADASPHPVSLHPRKSKANSKSVKLLILPKECIFNKDVQPPFLSHP